MRVGPCLTAAPTARAAPRHAWGRRGSFDGPRRGASRRHLPPPTPPLYTANGSRRHRAIGDGRCRRERTFQAQPGFVAVVIGAYVYDVAEYQGTARERHGNHERVPGVE